MGRKDHEKGRETERIHAAVLKAVRHASHARAPAVKVSTVAKALKKDRRTVKTHLRLLVMHHEGLFLDAEESVFALRSGLRQALAADEAREEYDSMSKASSALAATLWASEPD